MKITTRKSAKDLKWVRIKAAFYSKGLFFPIVNLLTSKSALQDSVYGSTAFCNVLEKKHFAIWYEYILKFDTNTFCNWRQIHYAIGDKYITQLETNILCNWRQKEEALNDLLSQWSEEMPVSVEKKCQSLIRRNISRRQNESASLLSGSDDNWISMFHIPDI